MAEWLALDWDDHTLTGVEGQRSGSGAKIACSFQMNWADAGKSKADADSAGKQLAAAMKSAGVSARKLVACIPREQVIVRRLTLPAVPEDEMPAMVRLQAATKLASSIDQYHLDYLPLPDPVGGGKEVLLCVVPRKLVQHLQNTAEKAGLTLESVGVSTLATAQLVMSAADPPVPKDGVSLILARHGERAEMTLLQGGRVAFMHSAPLSHEDSDTDRVVLAEVSRTLLAQAESLPTGDIVRGWVIGSADANTELAAALSERVSGRSVLDESGAVKLALVNVLDPTTAGVVSGGKFSGELSNYAGPIGMLLSTVPGGIPAIDFLNPRKPTEKKDHTKLRWAMAAGAALLIGGGSVAVSKQQQSALDDEISMYKQEISKYEATLKENQPVLEAGATVDEWRSQSQNSLENLTELNALMPGTERLFLTEVEFDPPRRNINARVNAKGFASSRIEVQDFYQRLDDAGYRVSPKPISTSARYGNYPFYFELDAALPQPQKPKPDAPQTAGTNTTPGASRS